MKFGGLINKKSKTMWISIIFICFFLLLLLVVVPATKFNEKGEGLKSIESLKRPDAGEGKKEYELIVDYNGERKETSVVIDERILDGEELDIYFDKAYGILISKFLGDNKSVDDITTNVNFVDEISEMNINVQWHLEDESILNYWGEIKAVKKETFVNIDVILTYRSNTQKTKSYNLCICVKPALGKIADIERINDLLLQANLSGQQDKEIILPGSLDGEKITFYVDENERKTDYIYALFLLPIVVVILFRSKKDSEKKKRQADIASAYSDIITKLSLLISTGMTPFNALVRISNENTDNKAYEEIRNIVRLIQSGIPQQDVYRQFGKRFGMHCYSKLGTLLEQSVVKGNSKLALTLKLEVKDALEEKKNNALKQGEKASTKLLIPMFMMLAVVMVVIMVPAFMSF